MKEMKKKLAKAWALLLTLLMCVVCVPYTAKADYVDEDGKGSLNLKYELAGVEFRIYRVADISAEGEYTLSGSFADYQIDLEASDSQKLRAAAQSLAAYAAADGITPLAQQKTGEDGTLKFADLETGLYLLTGTVMTVDDTVYIPTPSLVSMPTGDSSSLDYNPNLSIKFETQKKALKECSVVKIWNDKGHEKERPESLKAALYKDGKLYEEVTLNEENGWRYEWKNLSNESEWTVVEKDAPKKYSVSIEKEGTANIITNKYIESKPAPSPAPSGGGKLPQTGQLWWPVPVLAAAGFMLLLAGAYRKRKAGENNEK